MPRSPRSVDQHVRGRCSGTGDGRWLVLPPRPAGDAATTGDRLDGRAMAMSIARSQPQPKSDLLQSIAQNSHTLLDKTGCLARPPALRYTGGARVHDAAERMARIVAERLSSGGRHCDCIVPNGDCDLANRDGFTTGALPWRADTGPALPPERP
jgi:hypothetical protein